MALTDSLTAYWNLDEASGTRIDSHAALNLTANGTGGVGSGTGIGGSGTAADFELSESDYLSRASEAALQMGDIDFSICGWMNMESGFNSMMMVAKFDVDGSTREYLVGFNYNDHAPNNRFFACLSSDGSNGTVTILDATTFGAPSTATWYFLAFTYDAAANQMGLSINDGTVDTASHTGGAAATAAEFRLGALDAGGPYYLMDGLLQYVGIWKRKLSSAEITELYNGGAGLAYSGLSAAPAGQPTRKRMGGMAGNPFRARGVW